MLELRNIEKSYRVGDTVTEALKGVSVNFRKSEFVAVLGPSGCGKTTLLNVIGGLDKYGAGDLIINGKSTKEYTDADWDYYRNHSIGFVFQSYNLIPHQTVLANVELALTLSGVSASERKARALEALKKVGIDDQAKKKPNQLSGGQMQRVAIARALVNNPDILLADEPTGALDSVTSVQIMEILKEISAEKLVIMVTHNPELADTYATRIISLKDGLVVSDSKAFEPTEEEAPKEEKRKKKYKTSMSFKTALSLSLNNLMTKKARTALTSVAGSIGIIGIALILSLSSGFKAYINKVQEDTLSTYPIQIDSATIDMNDLLTEFMGDGTDEYAHELDKVYARPVFGKLINTMLSQIQNNDLNAFKYYIDTHREEIDPYVSDIKYSYGVEMFVYASDTEDGVIKVNPMDIFANMSGGSEMLMMGSSGMNVWSELLDNTELLESQYDVVRGEWPDEYNEIVLFVDENNEINDYVLCALGLADQNDVFQMMSDIANGKELNEEMKSYTYEEILGLTFKLVPAASHYKFDEEKGIWVDKSNDESYLKQLVKDGTEIKIVGIMRPDQSAAATSATGMIGYTHALTEYCIGLNNQSEIVKQQKSEEINTAVSEKYGKDYKYSEVDIFTGIPFGFEPEKTEITLDDIKAFIETIPVEEQKQQVKAMLEQMVLMGTPEEEIIAAFSEYMPELNTETTMATLISNLRKLGAAELETPTSINIYAKDFDSKDQIALFIDDYNANAENSGEEEKVIRYTDYVGIMMNSISTIIDVISYVLIAFVAISLIVSSIMIGIITYISVLERTKEIGILRSIGASTHDITRVFNAETLIVGFISGAFGILSTLVLNVPVNMIIEAVGDIEGVSKLPWLGGVILVIISMVLTFFAGLLPALMAARKDPVVALRTE